MDTETIKKFTKIVLITIVISFVADKLVFFGLNKISDKVMSGQAIGKLNHFLSIKDSADFIVFGNSRANHHIDVNIFSENGFNNGVDGTGIAYNSTLINTLDKEKKQLILVHIDTKNFFDIKYDGSDIRGLKGKYHRDEKISDALNKSGHLSIIQNIFYSMNYNGSAIGILKNYFKPSYDYRNYNGYDPLYVSTIQESMRDAVLSKAKDNDCLVSYEINPLALAYLKSIKSFVEDSNKTFLFVTSPMYHDTCDTDNKKLQAIMEELNLMYWDFTNLYNDTKDNSYWKDVTHMSQKGANAFSKFLLRKYNSL